MFILVQTIYYGVKMRGISLGMLLAFLAISCLMQPSEGRGILERVKKGGNCQTYLSSSESLGSYGNAEGKHQSGMKTKGGYFKSLKNVDTVKECFQKCVDTSKCWSFTFVDAKSKCSLSSKKGTASQSSSSSSMVQFCRSPGAVAGFVMRQTSGSAPAGKNMFSAADVQQHNSRDSAWVVVDGNVYDLTGFINSHPGGSSAILNVAGKDGSSVFNRRGRHSSSDRRTLEYYMIGSLDATGGSLPTNTPSSIVGGGGGDDDDDGDMSDDDFTDDEDDFTDDEDDFTDDEDDFTDEDD